MLEIFGSVFGRSKKSSSALQNSNSKGDDGPSEESFVVIKDQGKSENILYPALNFDQLRVNNDQASSSPNLNCQAIGQDKNHHLQPLDNVPFIVNPNVAVGGTPNPTNLSQCFATLDRIGMFLQSKAEYNFQNEKAFLKQYQDFSG